MHSRGVLLSAAALLAVPCAGQPATAQSGDAFAGIPGVTIVHYPVDGADAAAVRRSIDANRPTDTHDGQRVDALSEWDTRWTWRRGPGGTCDLRTAAVRYSATVRMPRLAPTARLTPAERADWDRYIAALARHEAGHVRYGYDHRGDILSAIRAATCATADAAARAALARLDAYHIAYDRETGHGATQGASFPAP